MHESPQSDQIQLEATFAAASMQAQQPKLKSAQIHDVSVSEGTKTLSPQEFQVKALADKAEDYKQQAKAMKARQQMAKAQQDLMKASRGNRASWTPQDWWLVQSLHFVSSDSEGSITLCRDWDTKPTSKSLKGAFCRS